MIQGQKSPLAIAVSAAIASMVASHSASAVNISSNGLGDVGISPYYTARNNFVTNISVINTSSTYVVAFKIRFREADNSRDARDFNVFLSPNDVWTARVEINDTKDAAVLKTDDTSCTAPVISADGLVFTSDAYTGQADGYPADKGYRGTERTLDGHFEIIEMGVADGSKNTGKLNKIAMSAMHPSPNCAFISKAYQDGVDYGKGVYKCNDGDNNNSLPADHIDPLGSFHREFCEPLNVLKVSANLVNPITGFAVEIPVTMLANFYNPATLGNENQNKPNKQDLMYMPGDVTPQLDEAAPPVSNIVYENGVLSTDFGYTLNPDIVSSIFSAKSVINEYDTVGGALTDWVITFPTKSFYADPNQSSRKAPFSNYFTGSGTACDNVKFTYYDREENTAPPGDLSPSPKPRKSGNSLCYEAQLLNFGTSPILDDPNIYTAPNKDEKAANLYKVPLDSSFQAGWMRLEFSAAGTIKGTDVNDTTKQNTFTGLPVLGFAVNANSGLNYASSVVHAYERNITSK